MIGREQHIYFVQVGRHRLEGESPDLGGPIKIGFAFNPHSRARELQTAHYEELFVLGVCACGRNARNVEAAIHSKFEHLRIRGEWFRSTRQLLVFIAEYCGAHSRSFDAPVSWGREI